MNSTETQTNFLNTRTPAKGRLNVPTARPHVDAVGPVLSRQSVLQGTPLINPFPGQLRAAAIDVTMWLL